MNTDCWGLLAWKGLGFQAGAPQPISTLENPKDITSAKFCRKDEKCFSDEDFMLNAAQTEDLTDVGNMASPGQRSSSEPAPPQRERLQVLSWLVLRLGGGEVVLQEALQVLKGGPLLRLLPPAGQHQVVQRFGAFCWTGHPVAPLHLVQHLPVHHPWESKTSF